ncbi:MAG: ABC transporter substrate-binding protein [Collinsella sp.]|nr:ABC transporter substrate-binding protein [Collinsella sp.]
MGSLLGRRGLAAALATVLLGLALGGCASAPAPGSAASGSSDAASEPVTVRVASLKGPTSIGLVPFMEHAGSGELKADYDFQITAAADQIVPQVIKGDVDIALVPANVASVLYNKTEGGVKVIDVNTLGVLHVVTGDQSLTAFSDLAGRTVYLTGKGTTPEYVMNHLLDRAGIADSVTLEFKSEPTEVVSALAADPSAVGVLPEPFVTAARAKNEALLVPVSLEDAWAELAQDEGSQLVTGVTVVRSEFAEAHPEVVAEFLAEHEASAEAVKGDPKAWGQGVVDAGIVDDPTIAARAIPGCGIACLTGDELESALSGYLKVLFDADPASIGGSLPGEDFYFGE